MPSILHVGPYRFFFYSGDGNEPKHIHVESEGKTAKFWLQPVVLSKSGGFEPSEINRLNKIIIEHKEELIHAWKQYFGD